MIGLFLAAAAIQLPVETDKTSRQVTRRSPTISRENITAAVVDLWIDPDGWVIECKLSRFLGTEQIAVETCGAAAGAKLQPARDASGNAVYGFYRTGILAFPPGWEPVASQMSRNLKMLDRHVDLVISLNAIPDDLASGRLLPLNLMIDQSGTVVACEPGEGANPNWWSVACEQATQAEWDRRTSLSGTPVNYVRNIVVEFQVGD